MANRFHPKNGWLGNIQKVITKLCHFTFLLSVPSGASEYFYINKQNFRPKTKLVLPLFNFFRIKQLGGILSILLISISFSLKIIILFFIFRHIVNFPLCLFMSFSISFRSYLTPYNFAILFFLPTIK